MAYCEFFFVTLHKILKGLLMEAKRILFITQEIEPYVPASDHTIMGRKLPQYIQEKGREIRNFMPKWGNINERRNQLHEVIRLSGMNIIIDDVDHPLIIKVASIPSAKMQVYFIDNEDFFHKRLSCCDNEGKEYSDNAIRAIFYARGVLETVKKLRWTPDVIHCQGWISAIVPVLLKTAYKDEPSFRDCKVVYSTCAPELKLPLHERFDNSMFFRDCDDSTLEGLGREAIDLQKLAIKYADGVAISSDKEQAELVEYAKGQEKPVLEYPGGNLDAYLPFFDEVWSKDKEA